MRKSALLWFGLVVTVIVALGLVVLSTASGANAARLHHGDTFYFMRRQFEYLAVGIVLCACVAMFDYRQWRNHMTLTWLFYAVVLVLLLLVFRYKAINGSHRWINLGFLRLQPSEFAKLVTVIAVAAWMDRSAWRVELFTRGALLPAAIVGVLALPVMLEPDFGSTMVIGIVGFMLMFVAGARVMHLLPIMALGVAAVVAKVATNDNRMARIAAFFGGGDGSAPMDEAAKRAAFQAEASLAAIGNSDIWGAGLGQSMQKYLYLPEAHTDFVFAIGAEEFGIVFSVGAVVLFSAFFALSVYIARKASDRFGRYLVIGMAFIIYFQAMFNIGVICKALPTKGMALPFFSYGGTNLLSAFFAVGTILSVGIHSYRETKWKKSVLARSRFQS